MARRSSIVGILSSSSRLSPRCAHGELSVATILTCSASPGLRPRGARSSTVLPSHTVADASASRCVGGGCADAGVRLAPRDQLDAREAVVVGRRRAQRDLVVARDDRVDRRRHQLDARRRIGHDLELERRRHVGDRAARCRSRATRSARSCAPRSGPRTRDRSRASETVSPTAAESNVAQRGRRAAGDLDDRALRHARRLADGEPFGRPAEIRGIRRAHRDGADERTVGHAHDRRVARRAAVGRDDRQIAAQRTDFDRTRRPCADRPATICVAHASPGMRCDSVTVPRRAAAICRRSVSPRSTAGGRFVNAMRGSSVPCHALHRAQDREQAVVEVRHGERERGHRDGRRAGRLRARRDARCVAPPARAAGRPARAARRPRPSPRDGRARRSRRPRARRAARRRASTARARSPPRRCCASCAARAGAPSTATTATSAARTSSQTRNGTGRGSAIQRALPSADAPSARTRHVAPTASASPTRTCIRRKRVRSRSTSSRTVMASGGS